MTLPSWYVALLLAGQEMHAFKASTRDNRCLCCGLDVSEEVHRIQWRLAL